MRCCVCEHDQIQTVSSKYEARGEHKQQDFRRGIEWNLLGSAKYQNRLCGRFFHLKLECHLHFRVFAVSSFRVAPLCIYLHQQALGLELLILFVFILQVASPSDGEKCRNNVTGKFASGRRVGTSCYLVLTKKICKGPKGWKDPTDQPILYYSLQC